MEEWSPNSRVIAVTSDTLNGPYSYSYEVLSTFHHNPTVVKASDGTWLMYVIGKNVEEVIDCRDGKRTTLRVRVSKYNTSYFKLAFWSLEI